MRTLIISDVHTRYVQAQWILDEYEKECDHIIFHGDFFDQWGDGPEINRDTAIWTKETMNRLGDKGTFLLSNHDAAYRFPNNKHCRCSGFDWYKSSAINKVLTQEDWEKFKLFTYHQGFYISHAGIHRSIFSHPVHGITPEHVQNCCDKAIEACKAQQFTIYMAAGRGRGGAQAFGGINWLDWYSEFEAIEGINQIVGHTPAGAVREKHGVNSRNYCMDTELKHVGFLEDGKFTWEML